MTSPPRVPGLRSAYRDVGLLLLLGFVVLGSAYAFLLPPFLVPDERAHWLAAHHHLAEWVTGSGRVCSTDVALDRHFQTGIKFKPKAKQPPGLFARVRKLEPECEEKLLYPTGNLLSYPGVLLSRLWVPREPSSGRQSLFAFYLSRLLHGLMIGLLLGRIWWLARTTSTGPPGLLALLLLSLSPLFVQQSFGVTIDAVTNAFALSLCLWLVFPEHLSRLDRAAFLLLGAISAPGKPVLAVVLLPAVALGLYLERVRNEPGAPLALVPALRQEVTRRRAFVLAVVAISLAGLVFAQSYSLSSGRAARQLVFIEAEPWRAAGILLSNLWRLFAHPSFFLDYLGYLDTRLSTATLGSFALLALLVGAIEGLGIGAGVARLARDAARRRALRPAWPRLGLLVALALASVVVSVVLIGLHAYLAFTGAGAARIGSLQPRYFLPHLIVSVAIVMALARTLPGPARDADAGAVPRLRLRRLGYTALLGLFAAQVASFVVRVSIDVLTRFA